MNFSSLFVDITIMTNASMFTDLETILMIGTFNPDYQEDVDDDSQGPALLPASSNLCGALHCSVAERGTAM